MKENKNIEELFQTKFDSFEPQVDANLWARIENSIQPGATIASVSAGVNNVVLASSLAVASVVGLVSGNAIYTKYQNQEAEANKVVSVITEKEESSAPTKIITPKTFEEKIEEIAKNDETILQNIEEVKQEKEISEQQIVLIEEVLETKVEENTSSESFVDHIDIQPIELDAIGSNEIHREIVGQPSKEISESSNENISENNSNADTDNIEEVELPESSIEMANVFSPNNDFVNDQFKLRNHSEIESFHVIIADKMGKTLFESKDVDFEWDGKDEAGNELPQGVYLCIIKAIGTDGKVHKKAEPINLLRR